MIISDQGQLYVTYFGNIRLANNMVRLRDSLESSMHRDPALQTETYRGSSLKFGYSLKTYRPFGDGEEFPTDHYGVRSAYDDCIPI